MNVRNGSKTDIASSVRSEADIPALIRTDGVELCTLRKWDDLVVERLAA